MNRWLYPGTFDPPTLGHLDLIERALPLCDELIVAVAKSREKSTLFSLEKRIEMVERSVEDFSTVRVLSFDTLLTEQVQNLDVSAVLRGVRAFSDFEYELVMALTNRKLLDRFETIFMMPCEAFIYLSSTLVKEVLAFGGDLSEFVPEVVLEMIEEKQ
ncbi:MAG: pantetheine-phosphate adenylyltransferase [Candidatus Krumholzibacteria bacterium]|jgi:pantetheine-phosphate adenylyltransferase|nr:pantetheine-phosphate adenylyltransferase [Candidatus Krumholzibacteria bacterium]MDP6796580.1 pantetheine-phosphate adenylyltransferase [Candidatus Krumholzibacteria bacterium]MDP7020756.1 pantetheine-phosphate adenylyltransferase [Candidatus Krumholzibacteria bacterium]